MPHNINDSWMMLFFKYQIKNHQNHKQNTKTKINIKEIEYKKYDINYTLWLNEKCVCVFCWKKKL